MKARIDIVITRPDFERLSKLFDDNPSAPSITIDCTVDVSKIEFRDSYTELVSGGEICSTTALVRCK